MNPLACTGLWKLDHFLDTVDLAGLTACLHAVARDFCDVAAVQDLQVLPGDLLFRSHLYLQLWV